MRSLSRLTNLELVWKLEHIDAQVERWEAEIRTLKQVAAEIRSELAIRQEEAS